MEKGYVITKFGKPIRLVGDSYIFDSYEKARNVLAMVPNISDSRNKDYKIVKVEEIEDQFDFLNVTRKNKNLGDYIMMIVGVIALLCIIAAMFMLLLNT